MGRHHRKTAVVTGSVLRIALVTPWNARSAIAKANLMIARELAARGVAVTIVRAEEATTAESPPLSADFPMSQGCDLDRVDVGGAFDAACYAVGNYYGFHSEALRLLARTPGVLLLHDMYLGDLAAEWARARGASGGATAIRSRLYGGGSAAVDPAAPGVDQPLTEWPAAMATAAVAHAAHYRGRLALTCPGPVAQLPLPVEDDSPPPPAERAPGSPMTVVTFGHVNANKLADVVISAIGATPRLRDRCDFRLLGPVENAMRERLSALASDQKVSVTLTGWIEDHVLRAELGESDVVVCLRRPITEGASMSAIVGLLSGRPLIVCDAGFYAEIPDDLAFKIPAEAPESAVAARLEEVLDQPTEVARRARRARDWALETFTAARYVDGLIPLIEKSMDVYFAVALARRIRRETRCWGLEADDAAIERIGRAVHGLFGSAG